jgi:hypothetical protein
VWCKILCTVFSVQHYLKTITIQPSSINFYSILAYSITQYYSVSSMLSHVVQTYLIFRTIQHVYHSIMNAQSYPRQRTHRLNFRQCELLLLPYRHLEPPPLATKVCSGDSTPPAPEWPTVWVRSLHLLFTLSNPERGMRSLSPAPCAHPCHPFATYLPTHRLPIFDRSLRASPYCLCLWWTQCTI